jgi:molybdopterin-guanine dinucleotide biosynthesis protein A
MRLTAPERAHALVGLVLAGGKSLRMGRDKACLLIDGSTLLARSVELARRFCAEVYVSGRKTHDAATRGLSQGKLRWLPDDAPGLGPMGGIATGLQHLKRPLLVLPCDAPLLHAELLQRLLDARNARSENTLATAFVQPGTGYLESLVAIYEPEILPLLLDGLSRGVYALWRAVPAERWLRVPYDESEKIAFLNLNTAEELALFRERLKPEGLPQGASAPSPLEFA